MENLPIQCNITGYKFDFVIQGCTAHYDNLKCDFKYPQALGALLRKCSEKLKEMDIKSVTQITHYDEWTKYLKDNTTWKILFKNDKDNTVLITCPIDDFLSNMDIGFGLTQ